MMHIERFAVAGPASFGLGQGTFGRDGAMFEGLLGFVAQLSLMLWSLVIITAVIRFVGIRIYRRGAASAGLVETVAPSATVLAAGVPSIPVTIDLVQPDAGQPVHAVTNGTLDGALQPAEVPAAVTTSVKVPHLAPRKRSAASLSPTQVPEFAGASTKA